MSIICRSLVLLISLIATLQVVVNATPTITGPSQPKSGPGGSDYAHQKVLTSTYGTGSLQYWLFEPSEPKPDLAPIVVFNHGWGGTDPKYYQAWIDHIVRKGNIVIFPCFQSSLTTRPGEFVTNATAAVKAGMHELQTGKHVHPDISRAAIVGHSAGGHITAEMAAAAIASGLPTFKAVMCVEPGGDGGRAGRSSLIPSGDLGKMPAGTLLLAIVGDQDNIAKTGEANRIINETSAVPAANKNLITLQSDDHGVPPLVANHFCPLARIAVPESRLLRQLRGFKTEGAEAQNAENSPPGDSSINALDYFGLWKLFDALEQSAFYSAKKEFALGNTPQQRYMGTWSDGVPVKQLLVQIGSSKQTTPPPAQQRRGRFGLLNGQRRFR